MTTADFRASARRTLTLEQEAIAALVPRLNEDFDKACALILASRGRVVVSGIGKSGHIGRKLAATLASTGTPAFFLHPAEASHGDLGMMTSEDVLVALSNSGETQEITALLPLFKRKGVPIIAMTGRGDSTLSRHADAFLDVGVEKEACPLNLAPTSSTTATLALGDALAIALLEARGFSANDFALSHPGGSLGKQLLLTVGDVMHTGDAIPSVPLSTLLRDTLFEITRKGLGFACIVDQKQQLCGIYTDGDLRRTLDKATDFTSLITDDVMSRTPLTVPADMLAAEALRLMETRRITALPVVDDSQCLVGALKLQDLLTSGIV